MQLTNFIHGEFVAPISGKYLPKLDPATAQEIYQVPDSSELDMIRAVQSAHQALGSWTKTSVDDRCRLLERLADALAARLEDFALLESRDVGKPLELARTLDLPRAVNNFRYFAGRLPQLADPVTENGKNLNYVTRSPLGVVGLIAPWNLPLYLLTWKIAPALATGNTVVCKPSKLSSRTAIELARLMNEVGLPPGVCNIVLGRGEVVGQTLVTHPGVRGISFTGGTDTGTSIAKAASSQLKRLSLELGGKNAAIILGDADLDKAVVGTIRSSFSNQGEICLCTERVFVQQDLYDKFLAKFVAAADALVVGDPLEKSTAIGPLISAEHREKVLQCVAAARGENGKLVSGGRSLQLPDRVKSGYYVAPQILTDLSNCSELHHTEIFGPVVTVQSFKYAHEAVKIANTTPYGLCATVWTKDLSAAHKVAAGLDVGTVWVNDWMQRDLRMPFGGTKMSGLGREGGSHSFDFFTELKTVAVTL